MSALPPKADIRGANSNVRFVPITDVAWSAPNRAQNPLPPNEFDFNPLHPVCIVVRPQTRKN